MKKALEGDKLLLSADERRFEMRPVYVKYDFTDLEKALSKLYTNQSYSTLNDIKKELNRFFKDSNCARAWDSSDIQF